MMSCKVEGCNQPAYHYNPLITCFASYHGNIVHACDNLPENGIALEVAARIVRIVTAPFGYFALGLTAFTGLIIDDYWKKCHELTIQISRLREENKELETLNGKLDSLGREIDEEARKWLERSKKFN